MRHRQAELSAHRRRTVHIEASSPPRLAPATATSDDRSSFEGASLALGRRCLARTDAAVGRLHCLGARRSIGLALAGAWLGLESRRALQRRQGRTRLIRPRALLILATLILPTTRRARRLTGKLSHRLAEEPRRTMQRTPPCPSAPAAAPASAPVLVLGALLRGAGRLEARVLACAADMKNPPSRGRRVSRSRRKKWNA